MKILSVVLVLLYVLSLLSSANAQNFRKRRNRMPIALRKFNITFFRGTYAFGPSTIAQAQCGNAFINPILPSTIQAAIADINTDGRKSMPTANSIVTVQQVNGTGLFRIGSTEVKIIARGPVFRGRYVFVIFFDGRDISTLVSSGRIFSRFFKRRVIRFMRRFRIRRVRNLLRNQKCRRMLPRKFMFPNPTMTPEPQDPPQDPQPQAPSPEPQDPPQDPPQDEEPQNTTPEPQEPEQNPPQDPEPDSQPDSEPEMTPMAEEGPESEADSESTVGMTL